MLNGLQATLAHPYGALFLADRGRIRSVATALLVTLALSVLSTAATRHERWSPDAIEAALVPTVSASSVADVSVAPKPVFTQVARPLLPPAARKEIEALTTRVAKKYRISPKVGRELIRTAYREGARAGVDPLLIIAVMAVESRFNPIAESHAGAVGLMQVIPGFHQDKIEPGVEDPVLDPHANIRLGTKILREYISRAGTEAAGLQRYNGASDDATRAYANKVFAERQLLRQAIGRPRGGHEA